MEMSKRSPCATCPFRRDIDFYLSAMKVGSILGALRGDDDFPCHKTTVVGGRAPGEDKACIGAAIFLEHVRPGGARANLSFRLRESYLKEFHRDELEMGAPVFTDEESFIAVKTKPFR